MEWAKPEEHEEWEEDDRPPTQQNIKGKTRGKGKNKGYGKGKAKQTLSLINLVRM